MSIYILFFPPASSICVSSFDIYFFTQCKFVYKKYIYFYTCAHVFFLRVGGCAPVSIYARTRARVSPRGRALKVCAARRAAERGSAEGGCEIVKFVSASRGKPRICSVLRKNQIRLTLMGLWTMDFGLWPLAFGLWLAREARFQNLSNSFPHAYPVFIYIFVYLQMCIL